MAIQFPIYEYIKSQSSDDRPSQLRLLLASTSSKLIASMTTYPHEVLRTRLQNQTGRLSLLGLAAADQIGPESAKGLVAMFKWIIRKEGIRGLYKGMGVNLIRTVPGSAVTLLSYEALLRFLNEKHMSDEYQN